MIHRVGDVEIRVRRKPGDFVQGVVYDRHGCVRIGDVPVYTATIAGVSSQGRGRTPADAIGDLIHNCPKLSGAKHA